MSKLDPYELEVLEAYESGKLKPIASKAELQHMRDAARTTAIKDSGSIFACPLRTYSISKPRH